MGTADNRPRERRSARLDEPVTITEGQLMDVLLLLDDLAAVAHKVSTMPDPGGQRANSAASLAAELRELRSGLRRPDDDNEGMGYSAGEWRTHLCAALDNAPLLQAGFAVLRDEMDGGRER